MVLVTVGGDFGDTGKGEQNYRLVFNLLNELGIFGREGYKKLLLSDPLSVLANHPVVFNYSPFGGGNAGNNIYLLDGQKMKTHLLPPATLFAPYTISMLGMRKNVHLGDLDAEVQEARTHGAEIVYGRTLFLDRYATITTDQDKALDDAIVRELLGTKRGNAPAMAGRVLRVDPRAGDLFHLDDQETRARIAKGIRMKNAILRDFGRETFNEDDIFSQFAGWGQLIGEDAIADGYTMMNLVRSNPQARVFINATQGQDLDEDTGTIGRNLAYGVSSGDVLKGTSLPVYGHDTDWVIIKKAYVTRAGAGLFPGEFEPEKDEVLRELGGEIGVTSGNKRRTGQDNLAETRFQVSLIGDRTSLIYTKVDVYGEFMERHGPQQAIVGYRTDRGIVTHVSFPHERFELVVTRPYFWGEISEEQKRRMVEEGWDAFPSGLQEHLLFAAQFSRAPVRGVALGPRLGDTATKGLYEETIEAARKDEHVPG